MGVCDSSNNPIIKQASFFDVPETKNEIEELYTYKSAICLIKSVDIKFPNTGFFCEINDDNIPFKKALFTCNHILDEKKVEINKEIEIEYLNEIKKIQINKDRQIFTNKKLDYTCIEIFDTDKIKNFFRIGEIYFNEKDINPNNFFILQYLSSGELSHSGGKIIDVENDIIHYSTSSLVVSSGSPVIKRYNMNLTLGIHLGPDKSSGNQYNYLATSFNIILKDIKDKLSGNFANNVDKIIEYPKMINLIYNKNSEYKHSNNIFGSEFVKNNKYNIKLKINGIECQLLKESYDLKKGINNIQLIIINKLTNLESMFLNCISLKNIDELKYLDTKGVNNFSNMFNGCSSLSDINALRNWDVSNGYNFNGMFERCSSLTNLNALSHWNVSNGNKFERMFSYCESISDLKALKNWNVSNGNSFYEMFKKCLSLKSLKAIRNWNVSNVQNFYAMFEGCSLCDLKGLENWDVSNGQVFSSMFMSCPFLSDLNALRNWNVSNGNSFDYMFSWCESLSKLEGLENWDVSNGRDFDEMFHGCLILSDIRALQNWNVIKGENFTGMFSKCPKLIEVQILSFWNFSHYEDMDVLFESIF